MPQPASHIRLISSAITNTGRVRQNNEDSVHLWSDDHYVLAIVADGMGGAAAGEQASRIAIETIHKHMADSNHHNPDDYAETQGDTLATKLEEVIRTANQNIVDKAKKTPEFKGMGTTVTLAFARKDDVTLAHVGDSRAYYVYSDGKAKQLTADHSFVQALVDAGHITADEAEDHPMKNVLYRALGQDSNIEVDIHQNVNLMPGDSLVLCSDGLTLHLKAEEIGQVVLEAKTPNEASEKLVAMANERGGKDNISVIVITAEVEDEIFQNAPTEKLKDFDETNVPDAPAPAPVKPVPSEDDEADTAEIDPDLLADVPTIPYQMPLKKTDLDDVLPSESNLNSSIGEGTDSQEPSQ